MSAVMSYLALKYFHVACVLLSGLGFAWRGGLMLAGSPRLQGRLLRFGPHVVDTLLLTSALTLAGLSGQYPFAQPWLTAKVCGLLAYIGLGTIALKRGRTRNIRAVFLVLALLAYGYIVSVALTRQPWPFS